jgi:hypothetical protein
MRFWRRPTAMVRPLSRRTTFSFLIWTTMVPSQSTRGQHIFGRRTSLPVLNASRGPEVAEKGRDPLFCLLLGSTGSSSYETPASHRKILKAICGGDRARPGEFAQPYGSPTAVIGQLTITRGLSPELRPETAAVPTSTTWSWVLRAPGWICWGVKARDYANSEWRISAPGREQQRPALNSTALRRRPRTWRGISQR